MQRRRGVLGRAVRAPFRALLVMVLGASSLSAISMAGAAHAEDTAVLSSDRLRVTVDSDFPRVIDYTDPSSGQQLFGNEDELTTVTVNGTNYQPEVTATVGTSAATYRMAIPDLSMTVVTKLSVSANVLSFQVAGVEESGATKLERFEIPGHALVSVRSGQPGATIASTKFSVNRAVNGDYFTPVADAPVDAAPAARPYAFVNTSGLAAGVETSAFGSNATQDPNRLAVQTNQKDGYKRTGVWSQAWLYRDHDTGQTTELPWAKVAVTTDRNGDKAVDWQDGAIAFRGIMYNPPGVEKTKNRVAPHIISNFASAAGQPFLKALDSVKKASLATDGLGQFVLLKGYQSEGHDSAHPDYGNVNARAGGAADMRLLARESAKYNAEIGVHIQQTESYPEAKAFDDTLVDMTKPGWRWLDQSYYIKQHPDLTSGNYEKRLDEMRNAVPEKNFDFVYMDVYFGKGWDAFKAANELHKRGWETVTEFPQSWERYATWTHWSTDVDYGPDSSRGINSQIIRFLRYHQKDVFSVPAGSLLPGAEMDGFAGWSGEQNIGKFLSTVFAKNLPVRYLQHHEILNWNDNVEIDFTGGVRLIGSANARQVFEGDRLVYDVDKYLLPWDSGKKLYHYNAKGGTTTWTLPRGWSSLPSIKLYRLDDAGRHLVTALPVNTGKVTIDAKAGQAYVLYPVSVPSPSMPEVQWGQGSHLVDPGFNAHKLIGWTPGGDTASLQVANDDNEQTRLLVGPGNDVTVSQRITGLTEGTYAASVWTQIGGDQGKGTRAATLEVDGVRKTVSEPLPAQTLDVYDKHGKRFQRLQLLFDVRKNQTGATLSLRAAPGSSTIEFDDVRVVRTKRTPTNGHTFFADFESVDQGWGPFIKGPAGGSTVHLSEAHEPWTNDTINGTWSLKLLDSPNAVHAQTSPAMVPLQTNHNYRVGFKYKAEVTGHLFVSTDRGGPFAKPLLTKELSKTTATANPKRPWNDYATEDFQTTFTTDACPNYAVGLGGDGSKGMLVIDDFWVDDLGPAENPSPKGCEPFGPPTGAWFVHGQQADSAYKRLSNTIDLTSRTEATLAFTAAYLTEAQWDFFTVEARPAGTDEWTTLKDLNGHTTTATGDACTSEIAGLHPQLAHYMNAACEPKGTTGEWNAATGSSGGWVGWKLDLTPFAGKQVEIAITSISDWGSQEAGIWVDDVSVTSGGTTLTTTSFEDDLGGWTTPDAPAGSPGNANTWIRTTP